MAKDALAKGVPDHDLPHPFPLKTLPVHIKLNVVIEEVYQQIRQGNFLKKGKTGELLKRNACVMGQHLVTFMIAIIEDFVDERGTIEADKLLEDRRWTVFMDDLLELHLVCPCII